MEDVKRSALSLVLDEDGNIEATCTIAGPSSHLLKLYSAAVETVVFASPDVFLTYEDLDRAHKHGVDNGIKRLEKKAQGMFSELSESSQDALLRLAKELNLPDAFLQKFTEGRKLV